MREYTGKYKLGIDPKAYDHATNSFLSAIKKFYHINPLEGAENLPKEGAAILMPKHQNVIDIPVITRHLLDATGRRTYLIMKKQLAEPENKMDSLIKLGYQYGFGVDSLIKGGGIPIERENPKKSGKELRYALNMLEEGNLLTVFPEATRTKNAMIDITDKIEDGVYFWMNQKGMENLKYVPIGIEYSKKHIYQKTRITMRVGKPFVPSKDITKKELTEIVMDKIAELSGLKTSSQEVTV